jgi:CRISPR-associated protein Csb2
MLDIEVEFLHGVFRATGGDDLALAGEATVGEWPPAPSRLFSALVAAGGSGERTRVGGDGSELLVLEQANPPAIEADLPEHVMATTMVDRFVVVDERVDGSSVQNYPARMAQQVRGGVQTVPRSPRVRYRWADVDPDPEMLGRLQARAARVGYLGCADSPARLRVSVSDCEGPAEGDTVWLPGAGTQSVLGVPSPGLLKRLDVAFEAWSSGAPQRRAWSSVATVGYGVPSVPFSGPQTRWLRFDRPIAARFALTVAETMRNALLEQFTDLAGSVEAVPAVLHGHLGPDDGPDHLCVAGLPFVGQPQADGRIRGVLLVLPDGTPSEVVQLAWLAANRVRRLVRRYGDRTVFDVAVEPDDGTRRKGTWSTSKARWTRPSTWWVSVTPVVMERRRKGGPTLDDVAEWCTHAGLTAVPTAFRWSNVPLIHGAAALMPHEVFRRPSQRRPYGHLEVRFDRSVEGPVLLGRGRHFGIGLMAQANGAVGV